jgi:hypothetical protein
MLLEASTSISVALLDIGLIFLMVWNVRTTETISLTLSFHLSCLLVQIICFDELKTDFRNPVDLCNSLNPVGHYA